MLAQSSGVIVEEFCLLRHTPGHFTATARRAWMNAFLWLRVRDHAATSAADNVSGGATSAP